MPRTITVKYSCKQCLLHRVPVQVPARPNDDPPEGVVPYVRDVVAGAIGADHSRRSPHCRSRNMSEVMIPVPEAENLGIGMLPPEDNNATADQGSRS